MVTLNELLADAVVELYEVFEEWHTIEHDTPVPGKVTNFTKYKERIGLYANWKEAQHFADKAYDAKLKEWSKLDEFDQLRIAVQERNIPRNADDYSFKFIVFPHRVTAKELEEKDGKTYWEGTEIL
ncbi:hypothetical protein KY336_01220 [Candidatus Woesearchaeota archaeon]|nr:hypothetical protein [Candidatus Woesearchaeota archaeon]